MEKSIAIIGMGNCGSQVAWLAEQKYPTLIDSVYINTSAKDLSMVKGNPKLTFKLGEDDEVEGSGKNRTKMKDYLKEEINNILSNEDFCDLMNDMKYVFIVCSAAGGTGSGGGPILMRILKRGFKDTHFILVSVLPQLQASLLEQENAAEFLNELYNGLGDSVTYMSYDNEMTADKSPTEGLTIVNENIVEDIRIITGIDNYPTPYDSIDEADMESIVTTPGRLVIARITKDLTEKNMEDAMIDDMVIKAIKRSCHTETDRNKRVRRWGIITYFTEIVNQLYNNSFPKLLEFIGTPLERFNHHALNKQEEKFNFFYLIASGMSPINDRTKKINDRIAELRKAQADEESSRFINSSTAAGAESYRRKEDKKPDNEAFNPKAMFDDFMKP